MLESKNNRMTECFILLLLLVCLQSRLIQRNEKYETRIFFGVLVSKDKNIVPISQKARERGGGTPLTKCVKGCSTKILKMTLKRANKLTQMLI